MGKALSKSISRIGTKRVLDDRPRDEVKDMLKHALTDGNQLPDDFGTEVQLSVHLKGLRNPGIHFVVLFERSRNSPWKSLGVTEMSEHESSPQFVRSFRTQYSFESPKAVLLNIYRGPPAGLEVKNIQPGEEVAIPDHSSLIYSVECPLAEALVSGEGSLRRPLGQDGSSVSLFAEVTRETQTMVHFDLRLLDLDSKILKGKSKRKRDLFVTIHRSSQTSGSDNPQIAKTESCHCAADKAGFIRDVRWDGIKTSLNSLCRGDPKRDIIFDLWEGGLKTRQLVGSFSTTFTDIERSSKTVSELKLSIPDGAKKVSLLLRSIQIERKDSFMDYISSGLSLNLFVAIDFTKSNKDPKLPDSLHSFADTEHPNDYVKVIRSVAGILESYDRDRKVPVYGFGARLPPTYNHTSHCFACNGDFFDPEVVGVDEIIEVYKKSLDSVVLHGPTNFHEIIKLVADFTEVYADPTLDTRKYSVLLILTDGVITDMKQTINEIVRAAEFPMSIVIIGIGDEDFGLMKILDGDEERLYSTDERKFASRDIVQFVKFNDYKEKPIEAVAAETLAEIPREVVNYFKARDIFPTMTHMIDDDDGSTSIESESYIKKQLEVMKAEFVESVKVLPDVDEFEVYRIVTEDRIPSRDLTFFKEIVTRGTRGSNVFSQIRPANIDSPGSATKGKRASISSPAPARVAPISPLTLVVDLAEAEEVSNLVADGKPLGSPLSTLSPKQRAEIAASFSVAHMKSPVSGRSVEKLESPKSPSVYIKMLDASSGTLGLPSQIGLGEENLNDAK